MSTQFYELDPNLILTLSENLGFNCTGEILQLNSYENRVFDIKLENQTQPFGYSEKSVIAKFFRPDRWSKKTILDEHEFCFDLLSEGLSVNKPLLIENESVFEHNGLYYSFYEKIRGRQLQEINSNQFSQLGKIVARLHNCGSKKASSHRSYFGPSTENKWDLLEKAQSWIAPEVVQEYTNICSEIFNTLDDQLESFTDLRIHGDLHRGNILETTHNEESLSLVDFDDFINGPSIQDMWMIFPEKNFLNTKEFEDFIGAYTELRHFNFDETKIISLLQGYRIISYSFWIMNRWNDPSFKKLFPEFNTYTYWAQEIDSLRSLI